MKVRPALLWVLVTGSALAGALTGTIFEGFIDIYLMQFRWAQMLGKSGLGLVEEAFSTVLACILGAALVGLVTFTIYTWFLFLSKRR